MNTPFDRQKLAVALAGLGLAGGLVCSGAVHARCADDLPAEVKADRTDKPVVRGGAKVPAGVAPQPAARPRAEPEPEQAPAPQVDPIVQLRQIATEAERRSAAVGAARLLSEAAELDVAETKAGLWPQVSLGASLGQGGTTVDGKPSVPNGAQNSVSLNVAGPLWDNGRISRMTDYRSLLANSAKLGAVLTQEQVVLEAVSAAVERNRYRLQAQVYQQFMRKMSCLVESLEGIVAEDRGRTSELVQARKTQAQAELQRDQALAQSRQVELRLRKLMGDQFIPGEGITLPLAVVPELGEINRQVDSGYDAQQLRAQIDAQESYSQSLVAGQRPQVGWNAGKTQATQAGTQIASWHAGVTLSYSLFNGFSDDAVRLAAAKRTEASRQQLVELLANKYSRTAEMYDVAASAFDRAKRYGNLLKDSEKVRNFTFMQWSQLGRRSLFDVMSSESDHFNLRIAYVNAMHDGYIASAQLRSLGSGLSTWLQGSGGPR
jgi:adhesin transport system outer membrane protein